MKITNKTLVDRVYIDKIKVGEIFFIEDSDSWGEEPFLKLDPKLRGGTDDWEKGNYILSLDNYKVYEIGCGEPLRKVNSELILT